MASLFTHTAIPLTLFAVLGDGLISTPLAITGVAASILPDIDVLTLRLRLPYESVWAHRGLTHSIAAALIIALVASACNQRLRSARWITFAYVFASMASHGALDALTDGGSGVAFFAPISATRYFLPWRVIRVSPLAPLRFFSSWGITVLLSEFRYVWLPCAGIALLGYALRRRAEHV